MSDEDQPLALVVVGHATTEGRIRSIMKHQGWRTEICGDGDKAVDEGDLDVLRVLAVAAVERAVLPAC